MDPNVVLNPVSAHAHFNLHSQRLLDLASKCIGWSGRTIRKLPVLAYSKLAKDFLTMEEFQLLLELSIMEKQKSKSN